ncbi:MAG: alpha/beta hydrolase, partial [Nocardioides sp.]|uniref:alpha/beta hydrolase fold domain-containing protein n=1 Tax=Nocardioides sp. TaxID=35761 RepID=UPI0039E2A9BC
MPEPARPAGPALPPPPSAAPVPAPYELDGLRVIPGIPYGDLAGARPLELDLYLPVADRAVPVVVFCHGGGWRVGRRGSAGPMFRAPEPFATLAAAGIAVASIDYRLSGEAGWPAQLDDAVAAVDWLRRRGAEVGVDPGRLGVWG